MSKYIVDSAYAGSEISITIGGRMVHIEMKNATPEQLTLLFNARHPAVKLAKAKE